MATTHYRIGDRYLGGYGDGAAPTEADAVECPAPPHGLCRWLGDRWSEPPAPAAGGDPVVAAAAGDQAAMLELIKGLTEAVEAQRQQIRRLEGASDE